MVSSIVHESLSDNILQLLQFRAPHGCVRPLCLPRARFLSLTTLFLMLGPVLLTNWNRFFLGFPVPGGFAVRAGVKKQLSLLFALVDLNLGTLRLGLADLELFVLLVMSGNERECLGVLALGSAGVKLISDVSDSEKLLVLESDVANFLTV